MKTETQEAYYNRKIDECLHELKSATELGKQKFIRYYKRELANYKQCLYNHLNQEGET
jgi:hypothetical protein